MIRLPTIPPPPPAAGTDPTALRRWYVDMQQSLQTCVDSVRSLSAEIDRMRPRVGLSEDGGSGTTLDFGFRFTNTSDTAGTVTAGQVLVDGASATITGFPSGGTITGITTSRKLWITVTYSSGAVAWSSGTSFPTSTSTVEVFRVADITCTSGAISSWIQYQLGDIHVTRSVVTSVKYDNVTHQLQIQTKPTPAWTVTTGGQFEIET